MKQTWPTIIAYRISNLLTSSPSPSTNGADVFSRKAYSDIILESLAYCQRAKGLEIYGWVIMTNHIHLLASCRPGYRMSDFLRDFKKFTAKEDHGCY